MKKLMTAIIMILLLAGCTPTVEVSLVPGVDTIEVYDEHDLKGCTVTIDDVEYQMEIESNPIDTEVVGNYIVDYEVDIDEETYVCQRVVFVVDHTSPELTLLAGKDTVYVNETWVDGGAVVSDNYDQDLTVVVSENTVDTSVSGTYQVTYKSTDSSGNFDEITRIVHVLESE